MTDSFLLHPENPAPRVILSGANHPVNGLRSRTRRKEGNAAALRSTRIVCFQVPCFAEYILYGKRLRVSHRRSRRRRWLLGFGSAREAPSPKLRLRSASLRMTHNGWQVNKRRACSTPAVSGLCPKLKYPPFYLSARPWISFSNTARKGT